MKIQWIIAALFLTAAYMVVPALADAGAGPQDQGLLIGMPDPSAVWANEMGYGYATRVDDQGGQYGVIILPDGTERDAWEAYREYLAQQDEESGQQSEPMIGMPNPSAVWADEMGYQYVTRVDDQGGQYGVIILPDGTERDAWEAYREYLAQQDESGQRSEPMIGVPGQTGYLNSIQSDGFLYRHDLFTYRDGTGRDSWSAFRESGALFRVHSGITAASLLGDGQPSRQSLITTLLAQ